ncbi:maleylacetate reductase [Streptomyces shenzhenensis]|uniref:maleylacetate reductase n=1 Tax=Streptomyces shenzhenensis TaxID=943815 RepID=UPI0015F01E59|nr:maleylacetate reductase [Streptomyces shenzhenensis]
MNFRHRTLAQQVSFSTGSGPLDLTAAVDRTGSTRALLIASRSSAAWADAVTAPLPIAHRFGEILAHVPVDLADRARAAADRVDADLVIVVGGGSAVGLAKAIALTHDLPIIAVPTTYSGSEVTPLWNLTDNGVKRTGTDSRVLPVEVVYDTELTTGLPTHLTIESALNSLAHCIDGLWAPGTNPVSTALGTDAIRILARGLYAIDRADADAVDKIPFTAREDLLLGAYLAGSALASTGPGMHHEVCHVLGGAFGLPHAALHAALLPYTLAFNAPSAPAAAERIARSLGATDALDGLSDLYDHTGSRRPLRDLGLSRGDIRSVTDRVLAAIPPSNPRPADMTSVRHLLTAAWHSAPWREVVDYSNSRSGSGAHV